MDKQNDFKYCTIDCNHAEFAKPQVSRSFADPTVYCTKLKMNIKPDSMCLDPDQFGEDGPKEEYRK